MTSPFVKWSQMAATSPARWAPPKPRTRIIVRLMPTIVGQHTVSVEPGEPAANTAINRTRIRFPDPLDDNGHPTPACRAFIVETIRDAIWHDRYRRWIQWPDGTTTSFTSNDRMPETSPSSRPVLKSAIVIHGEVVDRSNNIALMTMH